MGRVRERVRDASRGLTLVMRNPLLRRAQSAFAAAWAAEWAFTVALSVVAFRDGGATAVGIVALLRMLPSAVLAPLITAYADRVRRERVLIRSSLLRAAATAGAGGVLAAGGPIAVVYGLAIVSTVAFTPYRAAHSALLPSLCATVQELTSCNVVRGMLDSVSLLVGPLVAAALLEWTSAEAVFGVAAAGAAWSALVLLRLHYEEPPRAQTSGTRMRLAADVAAGARVVGADLDLFVIVALAAAQTFTRGCLTVLTVLIAIDLLDAGAPAVGVLTAAIGAGAVLGSLGATLLAGSRHLATWFGVSVAAWGAPLALIALVPEQATALVALAIVGVANAVLDVGLFTIIPRLAPDEVLARVFGVLEAVIALSVGLGAVVTPLVVHLAGTRGALAILGAVAPAAAALGLVRLRRLDRTMTVRDAEVGLLREVPLLRPLPMPTIEQLARRVGRVQVAPGEAVCVEGAVGDLFYVVADGEVEVFEGTTFRRVMRRGEGFGEIALLRDVPRTSTVRARTAVSLYTISRADFTPAVSGHATAAAAAATVMEERLAPAPG